MLELNSIIVNGLLQRNIPTFPLHPSRLCTQEGNEISFQHAINVIKSLLNDDIVPVLYGDVLLYSPSSFSILSGD